VGPVHGKTTPPLAGDPGEVKPMLTPFVPGGSLKKRKKKRKRLTDSFLHSLTPYFSPFTSAAFPGLFGETH